MARFKDNRRHRTVVSAVLGDTTIVEMVHDRDRHTCALLVYEHGQMTIHESVETEEGVLRPISASNNLIAHRVVLFPTTTGDFVTVESLAAEVRAFIHRFVDVSQEFEEAATWYVFLTWAFDAFNELPYLRIKGDYGSGKTRALQAIGSLCYKPMFASGASTVSPIFRIIDVFRGTLVLDESDFRFSDEKSEIIKILNNGNARGFPVLRSESTTAKDYNPRAFDVYGPKIIATRKDFDDPALESRCITEVMTGVSPRADIPLSLPRSFSEDAQCLRNKLLMYRIRYLSYCKSAPLPRINHAEPRVAQLIAPLLVVCAEHEARKRLISIAQRQTATIVADRSASIEAQILDIIYSMRQEGALLTVREIAGRFADRFSADFERPISPRWIGSQIRRRLSLAPIKSHGVFVIPREAYGRLDILFERFSIRTKPGDEGTLGTSVE